MALDPKAVGRTSSEVVHHYTWKDSALYALGIGATVKDLDFLYEKHGPKVYPTYAVVPTFLANAGAMQQVGGNMLGVVHGGQTIRLHKPFAPEGTLVSVGKVTGVYDLKRLAQAVVTTETRDEKGTLLCETEWSIIFRMDGGFGGEPPPKSDKQRTPDRAPDTVVTQTTSPEQAALYRLNGDLNPLHIDPAIAEHVGFKGPILHGLCTYGFVGRAVLQEFCGGDPSRLKVFSGQFRNPVWPGDTLVTSLWREEKRIVIKTSTKERPDEFVFANAYAEVE